MKRPSLQSALTFLIGWPLSVVALYFIYTRVAPEKEAILTNLTTVHIPLLILGTLCFVIYYFLRSFVWYRLLRHYHDSITYKESTSLWGVTQLKRYIPGNIWSFLGLTVLLGKKGVAKKDILKAILFEQQLVIISCVLVCILALPYLAEHIFPQFTVILTLSPLIAATGTLIYVYNRKLFKRLSGRYLSRLMHIFPEYPPQQTALLLGISALAFFILGAGYYFIINAFVFVTPGLFFQIIGVAVFSLLIGVLSFITPTGLGVREGVLAFMLSKVMSLTSAGFVSLFSRVVLIIAELLFVLLAFLWEKIQHRSIHALETFVQKHMYPLLILIGASMYTYYFSLASFLRYDNFYTGKFDLGNMSQTVWNTAHGNFFQMSDPNSAREVSRLAFHADFILILFAPFYHLWNSPKVLLFFQAAIVSLGAFFIYLIAKKVLRNAGLALVFAFVYLINPAIQWTILYDFHAVVLATTLLLAAWYFMLEKRYTWFVVFAILAGTTKEQVWFVIALLGIYVAVVQKKIAIGATIAAASILLFYGLVWHAIPAASGTDSHFALEYYDEGGESPTALIANTILDPVGTAQKLIEPSRVRYVKQLFLPLGLLSLAAPWYLIFASADIGINLLSDKPHLHQIFYQYSAVISPFLFLSAIYGIVVIRRFFPILPLFLIGTYLLTASLYTAYTYGPLPGGKAQNIAMFTKPQVQKDTINGVIATIPDNKVVTATNNLGAHLSLRAQSYVVPIATDSADIVVFLFTPSSYHPKNPEFNAYQGMRQNAAYEISYQEGMLTVFEKR